MPTNQNAHNSRTQGMSLYVKLFFQGGTRMAKKKKAAKKKVAKKKATKKKATKKKAKKKAKKKKK
jgi:hypothetical protein